MGSDYGDAKAGATAGTLLSAKDESVVLRHGSPTRADVDFERMSLREDE